MNFPFKGHSIVPGGHILAAEPPLQKPQPKQSLTTIQLPRSPIQSYPSISSNIKQSSFTTATNSHICPVLLVTASPSFLHNKLTNNPIFRTSNNTPRHSLLVPGMQVIHLFTVQNTFLFYLLPSQLQRPTVGVSCYSVTNAHSFGVSVLSVPIYGHA